jgi:hypothetical protein
MVSSSRRAAVSIVRLLVLLSSCLFFIGRVHALLLLLRCCSWYTQQLNNSCRCVWLPGLTIWSETGLALQVYRILQQRQLLAML